jgi:hypothetical protein
MKSALDARGCREESPNKSSLRAPSSRGGRRLSADADELGEPVEPRSGLDDPSAWRHAACSHPGGRAQHLPRSLPVPPQTKPEPRVHVLRRSFPSRRSVSVRASDTLAMDEERSCSRGPGSCLSSLESERVQLQRYVRELRRGPTAGRGATLCGVGTSPECAESVSQTRGTSPEGRPKTPEVPAMRPLSSAGRALPW